MFERVIADSLKRVLRVAALASFKHRQMARGYVADEGGKRLERQLPMVPPFADESAA